MTLRQRLRAYWLGTVDPRPLALFRIAFALVILADLVDRLADFRVFYTDAGLFPRAVMAQVMPGVGFGGAASLVGSPLAATIMFSVGGGAALLLLIGRGGRIVPVVLQLYILTVNGRAIEVSDGSDSVMEAMGFWLIFADSDAAFSLRPGARPAAIPALPVRLLELQLTLVYFIAGLRKLNPGWLSGVALFHVLQSNDFARPLGMALLDHPSLCRLLNYATLVVELGFAPLSLLWPRRGRVLAASTAVGLHVGIYVLMRVGMFPFVMGAGLCLFVPPSLFAPAPPSSPLAWPRSRRVAALVSGTLFTLVTASAFTRRHTPAPLDHLFSTLGVTQHWSMFQEGGHVDGYWSGEGVLADGTRLDILAAWAPRTLPQDATRFSRWYKLRDNMSDEQMLRRLMLAWICRQPSAPRLVDATLTRWERPVREPDRPPYAFSKQEDLRWHCHVP